MPDANSIMVMQDYGKIVFHFREVMDAKNITRNKLASLIGVRFEVADRLYNGEIERLDVDILARACFALDCPVVAVVEHVKESSRRRADSTPVSFRQERRVF